MKVAIDRGPLESGHKVRGVGAYTAEIIKAIKRLRDEEIKLFDVDFEKADLVKYDVVHFTHFHPYFSTLLSKMPENSVVMIHDLIQLIYPKQYQPGFKGKLIFRKQKKLVRKVSAIIVPSETTKKDVVRFLDIPPDKIYVIYEAQREVFKPISDKKLLTSIRKKYDLPSKFVLYVGDVNYNKNIPGLVEACKKADVNLVICGKQAKEIEEMGVSLYELHGPRDYIRFLFNIPHPELAHYSELVDEFTKNPKIFRLGFVPDSDLAAIYNLAVVYVQPSFYEGFGLPVLEAFASDTPVVVAKTNALVEVAGDASLVANPSKPSDIAEKIKMAMTDTDLRVKLIKKGAKRAKDFSWKKAAVETLRVYEIINEQ